MHPKLRRPALLTAALPVVLGAAWRGVSPAPAAPPAPGAVTQPAPAGVGSGSRAVAAPPAGDALLSALGCGGCHDGLPPPDAARSAAPALGPGAPGLPVDFVFEYLGDPGVRRPDIAPARMPDFGLSPRERAALARFLGEGEPGPALAAVAGPGVDRDTGRDLFVGLGCGTCHVHDGLQPSRVRAPSLATAGDRLRPGWVRRWLADPTPVRPAHLGGARMPDFRLTGAELDAVTEALFAPDGWGGDPARTPDWLSEGVAEVRAARAERLLETRYACRGCHVVAGRGGALGPRLDGLSERLRPEFVLHMIQAPQEAAPGSAMPRQPMPPREARILAAYLLGLDGPWRGADAAAPGRMPAAGSAAAAGPLRPDPGGGGPQTGAALYATWCAACHGPQGRGDGWNAGALPVAPTAHADAALVSRRPDDVLYDGIHGGGWVLGRSPLMPAFGTVLSPEQIDALVAHIRTLCDCRGPGWSRDGGGR